jgi:hypothetical protein
MLDRSNANVSEALLVWRERQLALLTIDGVPDAGIRLSVLGS